MLKSNMILLGGAALLAVGLGLRWPGSVPFGRQASTNSPAGKLAHHFPNVRLWTQENREVRFYDDLVKGRVVMINFMFTSCTSLCPRSTANLVRVQQALGDHAGRDVFVISISVDPEHDTPAVLKQYAEQYQIQPGWTLATGKREDIDRIRQGLGVKDNDDLSQHTGMLIYGNEPFAQWASTPVMQSPGSIARIVLRLVTLNGDVS
jgi:protein SCO1/2